MIIKTSRFGKVEIDPEKFLHFPNGIPGFEQTKSYFLIEYKEGKFNWLQAVNNPDLAFIVCDPAFLALHYDVPSSIQQKIGVSCKDELAILVIVRVDRKNKKVLPLVHAPLVFSTKSRQGMQWILDQNEIKIFSNAEESKSCATIQVV